MTPRRLYGLLFWGLVLPIIPFALVLVSVFAPAANAWILTHFQTMRVGGFIIASLPPIGIAMVACGSRFLARYNSLFLRASVVAALLALHAVLSYFLPPLSSSAAVIMSIIMLALNCLLGWFLLSAAAIDCRNHGQIDVAANARIARIIYVAATVVPELLQKFLTVAPKNATVYVFVVLFIRIIGYVVLLWTIQSAKIRLFPKL